MAKIDIELLLDQVKSVMKDNLNTKLTEVSNDKDDGIELAILKDGAYFLQTLDDGIANYDPYIAYGVTDIQTVSIGPQSADKIFVSIVLVLADNGVTDLIKRLFRYQRALKEIFEENWQFHNTSSKINVNSSTVVPLESLDSSAQYKAIGIDIELNLA